MAFVIDPDSLDRFQVAIDPAYKTISLRGSGVPRFLSNTGSGNAAGELCDTGLGGGGFAGSGANVNDLVAIINDPGGDNGVIGHYKITAIDGGNDRVTLDRTITQTSSSGIAYAVFASGDDTGASAPSLADGVTMQALYSFLKEEWRDNSLVAGAVTSGEDLIKFTFPMVSITSEQFEIGGVNNQNWEFADDSGDGALASKSPRNLIRTGGWASINNSGQIIENYPSIITLGNLGADSQVYYQLTSATTDPNDFVLTGPVNQSIRTLETIAGASVDGTKTPTSGVTQSVTFATSPDSMDFGSTDLYARGFTSGELIQIRNATDADNNGFFTITSSGAGATKVFVDRTLVANTYAVNASPMTDNRDYLVLRVRTKGQSYAQSEIADIGVSQINTIVNRFPLAESVDPAIVLDDGAINGDGTNNDFQAVSTTESNTTAVLADQADGTFTLTQTGAGFNTGGAGSQVYAGDTFTLTNCNPTNSGVYEVSSVNSDTVVVLIDEPLRGAITDESNVSFTARTRVRVSSDATNVTITDDTGGEATITDTDAPFGSVVVGDIVEITAATSAILGWYEVSEVTSTSAIKINYRGTNSDDVNAPDDVDFTGVSAEAITYRILQGGMHLAYKRVVGTPITTITTYSGATFTDAAVDGTYVLGGVVTITGSANNDGTYVITGVSGTTVTVIDAVTGAAPSFNSGDNGTGDATTEYGFVRKLGDVEYSFNWKLLGNGGDLGECFQKLQKLLRQSYDIDEFSGTSRGDITDLLMSFTAPNGTTLNLFIDDVDAAVKNNLTSRDLSGNDRNFPFLVALRIAVNDNILNAASNKIVVFFTDSDTTPDNGDEFGTAGATVVNDDAGSPMSTGDFRAVLGKSSPLTFTYNYTAGGGQPTPNADADITIVCISTDTGQYVSTTTTLTKSNAVDASLVAGLERNYSNP
jgi:hypothetical protein